MKDIIETLQYPNDHNIIIEVKSLNLGDDNMLTVDYDVINTDPKGTIDSDGVGVYMEQWLKELVDTSVEYAKNID